MRRGHISGLHNAPVNIMRGGPTLAVRLFVNHNYLLLIVLINSLDGIYYPGLPGCVKNHEVDGRVPS